MSKTRLPCGRHEKTGSGGKWIFPASRTGCSTTTCSGIEYVRVQDRTAIALRARGLLEGCGYNSVASCQTRAQERFSCHRLREFRHGTSHSEAPPISRLLPRCLPLYYSLLPQLLQVVPQDAEFPLLDAHL